MSEFNFSAGRDTVFIKEGDFNQTNHYIYNNEGNKIHLNELNENIAKLADILENHPEYGTLPDTLTTSIQHIVNNQASQQEKIEVKNFLENIGNKSSSMMKQLAKIKEYDDVYGWFVTYATPFATYFANIA